MRSSNTSWYASTAPVVTLVTVLVTALVVVGCGTRDSELTGGGAASFNAIGENTNDNLSPELGAALPGFREVRVISDVDSILTGSTDRATITAFITDENNAPYIDEAVVFSADSGLLQDIISTSDTNGEASASVQLAKDFRNQNITVQVVSNDVVGTAVVRATGTEIDISGSLKLSVGADAGLSARLTSGVEEPIPNEAIVIASEKGHVVSMASETTNIDGVVEFTVHELFESDVITISALDGSVTNTVDLDVVTELLSVHDLQESDELSVGSVTDVIVSYTTSGQPIAGATLRASLTAGQLLSASEARTNGQGEARFTITSSSAGPATLSINSLDGLVETSVDLEYVATVPSVLNLSSSSTRVSSLDTASIMAVVTDSNGNAVKNQEISFASSDLFGGQLRPASAITNSDGEASVTFTAGNMATEFEALNISAQIVGTGVAGTTQLTVVERVLNATIGTSNRIEERALGTQYGMPFVVQVADGGGAPLADSSVSLSARPILYRKGFMQLVNAEGLTEAESLSNSAPGNTQAWQEDRWVITFINCAAEDSNGNRLLDPGEDTNNNGILDPQDPTLLAPLGDGEQYATLVGDQLTTNALGTGLFEMLYPASGAFWSRIEIVARANALGSETEAGFTTSLPMVQSSLANTDVAPANVVSPYGTDLDCSNDN